MITLKKTKEVLSYVRKKAKQYNGNLAIVEEKFSKKIQAKFGLKWGQVRFLFCVTFVDIQSGRVKI